MGWFGRDLRPLQDTLRSLETALEDLSTCCSNNAENVRSLQSQERALRADMDLQWEKVNRAIGRFAKRDAVEEKANGSEADLNERIRRGEPIG